MKDYLVPQRRTIEPLYQMECMPDPLSILASVEPDTAASIMREQLALERERLAVQSQNALLANSRHQVDCLGDVAVAWLQNRSPGEQKFETGIGSRSWGRFGTVGTETTMYIKIG